MQGPISPPPAAGGAGRELPAYLSNGVVGLKVRDNPLSPGMTLLSGFSGEHPERKIEAAAFAPYPIAGDVSLDGVWMSEATHNVRIVDQACNFSTGELTTRLTFHVGRHQAKIAVMAFCSRDQPTLVCQEISVEVDEACDIRVRATIDLSGIEGRALRYNRDTPGEAKPSSDGSLLWESAGAMSTCGLAYVTELLGDRAKPQRPPLDGEGLQSEYAWRAHSGRQFKLRQLVSLVPSALHSQPDYQAARLIAFAADVGFDAIRKNHRARWAELWKSRIRLVGAEKRWQAMADAAFFYLMSSAHSSSPSSTSMFGLATWHDYHYYFGHVMWDIETFCVPPLIFLQPAAAESILDYRFRNLESARNNARLMGRRGLNFLGKVPRRQDKRRHLCQAQQPGAKTTRHLISPVPLHSALTSWAMTGSCARKLGLCFRALPNGSRVASQNGVEIMKFVPPWGSPSANHHRTMLFLPTCRRELFCWTLSPLRGA